jgi:hypothetical protein
VGAVSFGETIPLFRGNAIADSQWEAGIQAGVFALFQMDAPSKDLLNADYFASLFGTWRRGPFSALGRLFHQSSHLGDELLVRTRLERVNLTYESVDLKLSYDLPWGLRVYGGGGYLFDQGPESLKPWSAQGGVEFRSPRTFAAGHVRPVAAVDLQTREENKWNLDVSVRAGIQFENVRVLERSLQLLVEYFHGNSPDGQFYKRRIDYLGLGRTSTSSVSARAAARGGRAAGAGGGGWVADHDPLSRFVALAVPNLGRRGFSLALAGNGSPDPPASPRARGPPAPRSGSVRVGSQAEDCAQRLDDEHGAL